MHSKLPHPGEFSFLENKSRSAAEWFSLTVLGKLCYNFDKLLLSEGKK